jgi:cysteine-rich repeat protein
MFNPSIPMKRLLLRTLPLLAALLFLAPQAQAAKYLLGDNANLVKGCSGTIEIKIDTEGAAVMAGDSMITLKPSEVASVDQVSIGNTLPMQVFNQFDTTQIKLSGARLPMSGAFKGVGTFGYITFTPSATASQGSFTFSPDLVADNALVDENIENVLTSVVSKTYTFKDRYNKNLDGVGFCVPDTAGPAVQFVTPVPSSTNNPVATRVIFSISDDRSGVDINSLTLSIDGVPYNLQSPQVVINPDGARFRVEAIPPQPFREGASVSVRTNVCDKNLPANCTAANASFRIFAPTPPPAVCGDGYLNSQNGEQCDDGNKTAGDGCSPFCLLEAAPPSASTCFDGLQNQGEFGIDCGGPCSQSCPTCVDGVKNQNETGVDCGGPCPACGAQPKVVCDTTIPSQQALDTVIICHTPANDPLRPYTMMILRSSLQEYQANGDTMGPCSLEDMCNALMPVAPEIQKKAIEEATVAFAKEQTVTVQNTVIEAPKTQAKSIDQIEICKKIPDYLSADFTNPSADTDGDGLSDRTECYAMTSPIKPDTDGDGCTDGDELNRFNTNPLDPNDCKLTVKTEEGFLQALITDPKPSWTLGNLSPRFSGMVPRKTTAVTVTAFHADQKVVKALSAGVNAVNQASDLDGAKKAIADLKTALADARKFVDLNGVDFNYVDLQALVAKTETQLDSLDKFYKNARSFVTREYFDNLKKLGFGDLGLEFGGLLRDPIVIGSTNQLSSTLLAEQSVGSFELLPSSPLEDLKLYDVIATATLASKTVSSIPIQFGINTGFTVSKPIPRTLGGKLIPGGKLSFGGILIDTAFAQDGSSQPQITIDQSRPVITGDTEFGSQVFAIWNSVVLSSSVISDSEHGAFQIQAPKDLEKGIPHRVTLYAVKTDKDKTLRSESVDIHFTIKDKGWSILPIVVGFSLLFLLIVVASYLIKRMRQTRTAIKFLKTAGKGKY